MLAKARTCDMSWLFVTDGIVVRYNESFWRVCIYAYIFVTSARTVSQILVVLLVLWLLKFSWAGCDPFVRGHVRVTYADNQKIETDLRSFSIGGRWLTHNGWWSHIAWSHIGPRATGEERVVQLAWTTATQKSPQPGHNCDECQQQSSTTQNNTLKVEIEALELTHWQS